MTINIHQIRNRLPHRYPFLMIDRVVECIPGEYLKAIKNVTVNEPFFQGHFPHHPIFPGVMLIESMAQAAAMLASETIDQTPGDSTVCLFAGIDKARFKRPVEPGDRLDITVRLIRRKRDIWRCGAEARVEDSLAASADILFTYRAL